MLSRFLPFFRRLRQAGEVAAILAGAACGSAGATSTLSDAPLFTSSMTAVKPNIMFVLDDSGSMSWDFLPDAAGALTSTQYGKWASQCNGLAYNPGISYPVPVDATGATLGNAPLTWVAPDPTTQLDNVQNVTSNSGSVTPVSAGNTVQVTASGNSATPYYQGSTVTVYKDATHYFVGKVTNSVWTNPIINVSFVVGGLTTYSSAKIGVGEPVSGTYYTYTSGTQPKLGYLYDAQGNLQSNTFLTECKTASSTTGKFTAVNVTATSTEAQNYANWGKYYRTRIAAMRSGIAIAFKGIDSRYRVGYSTINQTTAVEGAAFLNIRDFDGTQKSTFYSKFNAVIPSNGTPLRGALARAGQYFANKAPSQSMDPMQYACQRNFTILSTDGMWNDSQSNTYPAGLDGKNVGQQDGDVARPMLDGNSVTVTSTDSWTSTTVTTATTIFPRVTTASTTNTVTTDTVTSRTQLVDYAQPVQTVTGSSFALSGCNNGRCNTATITTGSPHGYTTGDTIVVSGGNSSDWRGTYTVNVISSTKFSYTLSSRSNQNPSGTFTFAPQVAAQNSCTAAGNTWATTTVNDLVSRQVAATTNTTTSTYTVTQVVTSNYQQTHTYVVQEINGVPQAGVQTDGTLTSLGSTTTSTVVLSATATGVTSSTPINSTFTRVVSSSGACVAAGTDTTTTLASPAPTSSSTSTNGGGTRDLTGTTSSSSVANVTPRVNTVVTTSTGGVGDTLADVASYYYRTDLRNSKWSNCTGSLNTDVCADKVPGQTADAYHSYGDAATWQHMTTFTLGLGVAGTLNYLPNYQVARTGDFYKIVNRQLNWPAPVGGEPTTVDDLWHAAVDGRGQYFSAGDPQALTQGLNSALAQIQSITGAASAASTSSLQPVQGDNDIYVAQFTTQEWIGDVLAYKIDPNDGSISSAPTWSAKTQLGLQDPTTRTIYYKQPGTTTLTLRPFTYANLTTDGLNGIVDNFCTKTSAGGGVTPDQCASLSVTDTALANAGANLVKYLRGDQTLPYYRSRMAVLGDVMNASPLFIGKPGFRYTENNYQTFVTNNTNRTAIVLAAANDGMLHAFDRTTGNERWAYIPSFVLPNLYMLADNGYMNNHHYYVDGSPQVGDIFVGGAWKTIVVGGLNKGGRGYYALDVTDPGNPRVLWEFQDDNMGYSYGNPIITKRADGTWVVVFTSGYENNQPATSGHVAGDGNGHLFVVDANTGAKLLTVDTMLPSGSAAGTSTAPSGLAKINSWVDSEFINTSQRFYGGDLMGNLWRFDIDNLVQPNQAALQLAQLKAPDGSLQPITVKPALAQVQYNSVNYPVVYLATGAYLRTTDVSDNTVESIYAIKDPLTATGWGDVRARTDLVTQTITTGTDANGRPTRSTTASGTVDWSTKVGWRVDFPVGGERVSVDPQLALTTLYLGSNLPSADSCTVGGASFLYQFDINNGLSTGATSSGSTARSAAVYVGAVLVQGLTVVQLTTGAAAGSVETIITRSDGTLQTLVGTPPASSVNLKRTSWRELVD